MPAGFDDVVIDDVVIDDVVFDTLSQRAKDIGIGDDLNIRRHFGLWESIVYISMREVRRTRMPKLRV